LGRLPNSITMDQKAVITMRLLGSTSDYTFAEVPNPMAQAAREVNGEQRNFAALVEGPRSSRRNLIQGHE
jgi:hypothetical protein